MKMKFLLALMAGTVALSAQAEFQKCNGSPKCLKTMDAVEFAVKEFGNDIFEAPNGKEIPISVLKNAKLEAYYDNERDIALAHSPNANCQQLWVLAKLNNIVKEIEKKDQVPGAEFFLEKIHEKKCTKSLGLKELK